MNPLISVLLAFHILLPSPLVKQIELVTLGGGTTTFTVVGSTNINCVSTYPCAVSYAATAGNAVCVDGIFVDNGAGATLGVTDNGSSSYTSIFQATDAVSGGNG